MTRSPGAIQARQRGQRQEASAAQTLCTHCGLEVPKGLVSADRTEQFCCAGCESVWSVLQGAGLDGYYRVREAVDGESRPPARAGTDFDQFADPAYQRAFVKALPGGVEETEFLLEGVHCAACVWLLERLPRVAPGVIESRVGIRSRVATVRYRPSQISTPEVARQLDRLGYAPHPARGRSARAARARTDRAYLIRVAVAGACAGNVMLVAIALHAGAFSGIEAIWETAFRWVSMGLGLISLLGPGRVFFRGALAALRTRTAHLDLPIAIALGAGGAAGIANTISGHGEIYFDSLTVLVFLLLVGRWVQHRQQRAAADSIELMLSLTPSSAARVEPDGTTRRVPIDAVVVGDLVEVLAGDAFPADGVVESGDSSIDEALLTGESAPRHVAAGDGVAAGSGNLAAPLRVRVVAVGEQTRIGRIMSLVSEAAARGAPIVRVTDRVAAWFVPVVLVLAAFTFAAWIRVGFGTAIDHTTALLIVACPCALGLAVPLAMGVATGRAARDGMLVKDASVFQVLAKPGTMVLDKTGTITEGDAQLLAWHGDRSLLPALGALEQGSSHPFAVALAPHADPAIVVSGQVHVPGCGVRGIVDGVDVTAGTATFLQSTGSVVSSEWTALWDAAAAAGKTPVLIAADGAVRAMAELGDAVRPGVLETVENLRAIGWNTTVLSGDQQGVVDAVCAQIGLAGSGTGGVTPEEKANFVDQLRHDGHRVVMVGDGVNDAAAMALAQVGIAVHGGAEASLEAADVYLVSPGLEPVLGLVMRARSTMRTVRLCLGISVGYNLVAAALAMSGVMSALLAAIIMPASSLVVVAIALRAGRGRRSG